MKRIMSLNEFSNYNTSGANPADDSVLDELNLDETMLDALVELVGSEEEVAEAAEASFNDLTNSFEKNELEMLEEDVPEKLAISALIVKLVELGKIGPEEADQFIADHLED